MVVSVPVVPRASARPLRSPGPPPHRGWPPSRRVRQTSTSVSARRAATDELSGCCGRSASATRASNELSSSVHRLIQRRYIVALAARSRDAIRPTLVGEEKRLDHAPDPLVLRRGAGENLRRQVGRRKLQALHEVLATASDQVVQRGEQRLHRLHRHTRLVGDLGPRGLLDPSAGVQLERALDDSLAGGIDLAGLAGLVAVRRLEAAAECLLPEVRVG